MQIAELALSLNYKNADSRTDKDTDVRTDLQTRKTKVSGNIPFFVVAVLWEVKRSA